MGLISRTVAVFALFGFIQMNLFAQTGKIEIRRQGESNPATTAKPNIVQGTENASDTNSVTPPTRISSQTRADIAELEANKKDLWLAVGLSLLYSGGGHLYLGNYTTASILFIGTYGFMGAGLGLTLASHQSKTTRLDGEIVRIDTDSNKPMYLVGILCITSSVLMFTGGAISVFLETSDYNRRLERLKRLQNRRQSQILPGWTPYTSISMQPYTGEAVWQAGVHSRRF